MKIRNLIAAAMVGGILFTCPLPAQVTFDRSG